MTPVFGIMTVAELPEIHALMRGFLLPPPGEAQVRLHAASSEREALEMLSSQGVRVAVAFVDTAPGNARELRSLLHRMWYRAPGLQIVLLSDSESEAGVVELIEGLGADRTVLIVQKPPAQSAVRQAVVVLGRQWDLRRERVASLETENERLRASLGKAVQESRAKSALMAKMSHEIRSSLSSILGMADVLLDCKPNSYEREAIEVIHMSGDAVLNLINDILDLSRVDSGMMVSRDDSLDLLITLQEATEHLVPVAGSKGISICLEFPPVTPRFVLGDVECVRQLIVNVIAYVVELVPAGQVVIAVGYEVSADGKEMFIFEIEDAGSTTSTRTPSYVIDKLLNNSVEPSLDVSELRFAFAKRLAQLMGGDVECNSIPGAAMRFSVFLPLRKDAAISDSCNRVVHETLAGTKALLCSLTHRATLSDHLEYAGMTVACCVSAPEIETVLHALEAGTRLYDVLLVDAGVLSEAKAPLCERFAKVKAELRLGVISTNRDAAVRGLQRVGVSDGTAWINPLRLSELGSSVSDLIRAGKEHGAFVAELRQSSKVVFHNARVLVGDDNTLNLGVTKRMLEKLGCRVDVADNGEAVLQLLENRNYQLILIDCDMPVMDGYQATCEIRRREGAANHIPIIALTANALKGDRDKCLGAGMDDYLTKPVTMNTLLGMMLKWLPQACLNSKSS